MAQLVVGTTWCDEELRERLANELRVLEQAGLPCSVTEERAGPVTLFYCSLHAPSPDARESLRTAVAQAVGYVVVERLEVEWLRRLLRRQRPQYTAEEIAGVVEKARAELDHRTAAGRGERANVSARLLAHLGEESVLNVEGFFRFRLRSYADEIARCLRVAVRRFEKEREYAEFVKLLRFFLECQEPVVEELHILPDGQGSFSLEDPEGAIVHDGDLEEFVTDLSFDGQVRREDLLISALLTLAPQHVYCHLRPDVWNLVTLEDVLAERLNYCSGCARCSNAGDS